MHEHFDPLGNRTGYTRVTVAPRVTDDDRAQILALAEVEDTECPCGCGQPIDEATDPKRAFNVESFRCYARRALERERRRQYDEAERNNRPDGWDDGLSFYVEDSGHWTPENRLSSPDRSAAAAIVAAASEPATNSGQTQGRRQRMSPRTARPDATSHTEPDQTREGAR